MKTYYHRMELILCPNGENANYSRGKHTESRDLFLQLNQSSFQTETTATN